MVGVVKWSTAYSDELFGIELVGVGLNRAIANIGSNGYGPVHIA